VLSNNEELIAVTGATGQQGGAVVALFAPATRSISSLFNAWEETTPARWRHEATRARMSRFSNTTA
jgi:hypothetical protein